MLRPSFCKFPLRTLWSTSFASICKTSTFNRFLGMRQHGSLLQRRSTRTGRCGSASNSPCHPTSLSLWANLQLSRRSFAPGRKKSHEYGLQILECCSLQCLARGNPWPASVLLRSCRCFWIQVIDHHVTTLPEVQWSMKTFERSTGNQTPCNRSPKETEIEQKEVASLAQRRAKAPTPPAKSMKASQVTVIFCFSKDEFSTLILPASLSPHSAATSPRSLAKREFQ